MGTARLILGHGLTAHKRPSSDPKYISRRHFEQYFHYLPALISHFPGENNPTCQYFVDASRQPAYRPARLRDWIVKSEAFMPELVTVAFESLSSPPPKNSYLPDSRFRYIIPLTTRYCVQ